MLDYGRSPMSATRQTRYDPDAIAALEEERTFLFRSLRDLDAELEAGDIDAADYAELKDDYTRRTADVIRALEHQEQARPPRPPVQWRRVAVWLVGLALLGGISGALIARSSGARSGNETFTGGARQSAETRLNQARVLLGDQARWDEAIDLYDSVLDDNPSSAEALTYRGWLEYRQGDDASGPLSAFEEASQVDPDYPDAIVFHTIVLADQGRYGDAASVLSRLDLETAPDAVRGLVEQRGLAGEIYGETHYVVLVEGSPTLDDLGLTVDDALAAAGYLLSTDKDGRTVAALKLYDAVEEVEPGNTAALSRQAILLAFTGDPELVERARDLVDRAIAADPMDPEALLSRATVLFAVGDDDLACADLVVLASRADVAIAIADQAARLREANCPG